MEDYWNKMQNKFIETGQYPQQLPLYNQPPPMNNSQQIPKASNPIDNENNNPYYPYQASDFQQQQKVEQFDGIIDPKQNKTSGQGHYGFRNSNSNGNGNGKWYDEIKNIIDENMSTEAKYLCIGTSVIWLIIMILIFNQF